MKTLSSNGLALKAAMALRGARYLDVAAAASERLPKNERLSEVALSRIVTGRKTPTPEQAAALADVLGCPVSEIFPDLGNESSKVRKPEGGEA